MGECSSSGGNKRKNERRAEGLALTTRGHHRGRSPTTAINLIRQDKNFQDELWLQYWANGGSAGSA